MGPGPARRHCAGVTGHFPGLYAHGHVFGAHGTHTDSLPSRKPRPEADKLTSIVVPPDLQLLTDQIGCSLMRQALYPRHGGGPVRVAVWKAGLGDDRVVVLGKVMRSNDQSTPRGG